ncbi:ORF047L [Rock bream iridovirus]|uniref:ORF047L n=2 Tax=Infectious spleen and kidney necrosis virus TaxID=180170 RepID=Q5YF40_ISKNV|nr:ORF047L [Rock bream iridovirus]AMM72689.1 ORF055L [giant sea perch iridovirus - K1]
MPGCRCTPIVVYLLFCSIQVLRRYSIYAQSADASTFRAPASSSPLASRRLSLHPRWSCPGSASSFCKRLESRRRLMLAWSLWRESRI